MSLQWILMTIFPSNLTQVIVDSDGYVSHGVNEKTGKYVVLPNERPQDIGAKKVGDLWFV